jgi:hypothetical protein
MTWAEAVAGPLAGAACLWQDLDGLHVEPAPPAPPPTSILWGWRGDSLVRARLDGDVAYVAVCDARDATPVATQPWDVAQDERVAANAGHGPSADSGGVGSRYEQVVLDGEAPVTFVRPVRHG